ncbi:TFIIB-type zinc ribbon-containing protein [Halorarius litoreus]|uniref:TFIIB-type zinc ribbon-containing protein n=1 Tax=Halorarius litoreus TaxID=2962676 RepID=UPI0020CC374C|nr:TFIIB-type zinc ribbon-containing protein [Halorarius litoreus]
MRPPRGTADRPSIRKSVLFCPACGHESQVGGDWIVRDDAREVAYVCPDCTTVIESRPAFETNSRRGLFAPLRASLTAVWRAAQLGLRLE